MDVVGAVDAIDVAEDMESADRSGRCPVALFVTKELSETLEA